MYSDQETELEDKTEINYLQSDLTRSEFDTLLNSEAWEKYKKQTKQSFATNQDIVVLLNQLKAATPKERQESMLDYSLRLLTKALGSLNYHELGITEAEFQTLLTSTEFSDYLKIAKKLRDAQNYLINFLKQPGNTIKQRENEKRLDYYKRRLQIAAAELTINQFKTEYPRIDATQKKTFLTALTTLVTTDGLVNKTLMLGQAYIGIFITGQELLDLLQQTIGVSKETFQPLFDWLAVLVNADANYIYQNSTYGKTGEFCPDQLITAFFSTQDYSTKTAWLEAFSNFKRLSIEEKAHVYCKNYEAICQHLKSCPNNVEKELINKVLEAFSISIGELFTWVVDSAARTETNFSLLHYLADKQFLTPQSDLFSQKFSTHNGVVNAKIYPLHYAAQRNNSDVVDFLLQKGFDPQAMDKNGKWPEKLSPNPEVQYALAQARQIKYPSVTQQKVSALEDTVRQLSAQVRSMQATIESMQTKLERKTDKDNRNSYSDFGVFPRRRTKSLT